MDSQEAALRAEYQKLSDHRLRNIMNSPFSTPEEQRAATAVWTERGMQKGSGQGGSSADGGFAGQWIGEPEEVALAPILAGIGLYVIIILLSSTLYYSVGVGNPLQYLVSVISIGGSVGGMFYFTRHLPMEVPRIVWLIASFFLSGLAMIIFGLIQYVQNNR